jgi:dolichol-phosphate mannosyltransferase
MKCYVCLPAYNEEDSLGSLLERYVQLVQEGKYNYEIILVNDGSSDRTVDVASAYKNKLPLDIITHEINKGLGEAIKTGFNYAAQRAGDEDIIIYMDSDDTHDPVYIPSMIQKIQNGYDLVIASRYQKGSIQEGVPYHRRLLSRVAGFVFQCFLPVKQVQDYTCGYRAYKASLIKKALSHFGEDFITAKGFACTDEILIKLAQLTDRIAEVPFTLYYNRKIGESKLNLRKTIPATLKLLWTRGKRF